MLDEWRDADRLEADQEDEDDRQAIADAFRTSRSEDAFLEVVRAHRGLARALAVALTPGSHEEPPCAPAGADATEEPEEALESASGAGVERRYTVKQAAELAACHIDTVVRAIQSGRLPARKRGGGETAPWLIKQSDLEEWL